MFKEHFVALMSDFFKYFYSVPNLSLWFVVLHDGPFKSDFKQTYTYKALQLSASNEHHFLYFVYNCHT